MRFRCRNCWDVSQEFCGYHRWGTIEAQNMHWFVGLRTNWLNKDPESSRERKRAQNPNEKTSGTILSQKFLISKNLTPRDMWASELVLLWNVSLSGVILDYRMVNRWSNDGFWKLLGQCPISLWALTEAYACIETLKSFLRSVYDIFRLNWSSQNFYARSALCTLLRKHLGHVPWVFTGKRLGLARTTLRFSISNCVWVKPTSQVCEHQGTLYW